MIFITAVVPSADRRGKFCIRTTLHFPLQNIRSAFIDQKYIEIGNADVAANVLGCAAKVPSFSFSVLYYLAGNSKLRPGYVRILSLLPPNRRAPASCQFEEGLRNAVDANGTHQRAKIQAMLIYYSSRMEAVSFLRVRTQSLFFHCCQPVTRTHSRFLTQAWREGNDGVAEFMLQKITGASFTTTPPALDLELRGKSVIKSSPDPTEHVNNQTVTNTIFFPRVM